MTECIFCGSDTRTVDKLYNIGNKQICDTCINTIDDAIVAERKKFRGR